MAGRVIFSGVSLSRSTGGLAVTGPGFGIALTGALEDEGFFSTEGDLAVLEDGVVLEGADFAGAALPAGVAAGDFFAGLDAVAAAFFGMRQNGERG